MAYSKLRNRDMNVERELANFLDKHLYSQPIFSQKQRTDDIDSQMDGSDLIISIPSKSINNIIVDEKAQTQYINRPLPTFSLELSFLTSSNNLVEGWFTDSNKKTEYYLFQWIPKAKTNWNLKEDDILELEYALVSRDKIFEYLQKHGYTKEALKEKDKEIRATNQYGQHEKGTKDFWFFYSTNLAEKPINLIIKKKVYLELATLKGIISL